VVEGDALVLDIGTSWLICSHLYCFWNRPKLVARLREDPYYLVTL
jgi:hypothetical protein